MSQCRTFGFRIYQGVGHAFHNDTGPAYDSAAACDAWSQTLAWFNKFLRKPLPQPDASADLHVAPKAAGKKTV